MSATPLEVSKQGLGQRIAVETVAEAIRGLWNASAATRYGLSLEVFEGILIDIGDARNWGAPVPGAATPQECVRFLQSLKIGDLVLARACAAGDERAWERFLLDYRELLYSAAYAITRQDSLGRELADSLYADLYCGSASSPVRRSRLESFTGRGSLAGWLRSVLAQRFVDQYRRTRREVSLEDQKSEIAEPTAESTPVPANAELAQVGARVGTVLKALAAEDRFLIAAYYLDQRTLAQIAKVLRVHESTVSRKLHSVTRSLRKLLVKQLQSDGYSRDAAEEALGIDVRDLNIDVRRILQAGRDGPFLNREKDVGSDSATGKETEENSG